MDEYKYKSEFNYNMESHLKIICHINRKTKKSMIGFFIFALVNFIASIIYFFLNDSTEWFIIAFFMFLVFSFLLSSMSKKTYRKNLLNKYNYSNSKFEYEFYDDYIKATKTGGEFESVSKIKFSLIVAAVKVESNLGYLIAKDQSVVFLSGDNIDEIIEFVKTKIKG